MNPRRAEQAIQWLSIAGIWLAVIAGALSFGGYGNQMKCSGAELPELTRFWAAIAPHWATLLVPAACSVLILGLQRRASAHSTWVAGAVLLLGLAYALAVQAAIMLPMHNMCAKIVSL